MLLDFFQMLLGDFELFVDGFEAHFIFFGHFALRAEKTAFASTGTRLGTYVLLPGAVYSRPRMPSRSSTAQQRPDEKRGMRIYLEAELPGATTQLAISC
jgi:hypothetical protein